MPQTFQTSDGSKLIWAEDKFMKDLDRQLNRNMAKALAYFKLKVQRNVSVPSTIIRSKKIRGSGKLKQPIRVHSKPGEFPRLATSFLRRSIFSRGPRGRGKHIEGDVGTALDYAIHHEVNTGRSFLRRTLVEEQKRIGNILSEGQ